MSFKCMLSQHSARYKLCLAIIWLIIIALPAFAPTPAQAADPVKLVLGGEGSTPWSITDIKPCFSGTKTVTLHNAGTSSGTVFIWISDIVSNEGINPESETGDTTEPGELDQYLLFNLTATNLSTNINLPTTIVNLPQSVSDTKYIKISPLNAGATVTLVWNWQLPCQTGNDVQGDALSFTLNYTLELPTTPTPKPQPDSGRPFVPPPKYILPTPEPPGIVVGDDCPYVSPGDIVELKLEVVNQGHYDAPGVTMVYRLPTELIIISAAPQESTGFVENQVNASLGTIKSGESKVFTITVRVGTGVVPNTLISILLGQALLGISDTSPCCKAGEDKWNVSQLTIEPIAKKFWFFFPLAQIRGEQADITVEVENLCEVCRYDVIIRANGAICNSSKIIHNEILKQCDDYEVTLKINGVSTQTRQVTLCHGAGQEVAFDTVRVLRQGFKFPGRLSSFWWVIPTGKYAAYVNGLQVEFTSELWLNWLLILITLLLIALLLWLLFSRRKRKPQKNTR